MRATAALASALATLVATTAVAAPLFEADPPGTFELPVIGEAAEFTVRNAATGEQVRLSDLRGRAVVLSLIYASCVDGNACPLATATLAAVQRKIGARGLADRVVLLSITFDEQRDTTEVLRRYGESAGAGKSWIFATPETRERREALLAGYDQRIVRAPDGTLTHPLRVHLIDPRGRIRQIYSQSFLRPDVLMSDVETVLAEDRTAGGDPSDPARPAYCRSDTSGIGDASLSGTRLAAPRRAQVPPL
jgi:cytochrome oxidase Cu insertion factor (SCO1/SenC/PrrC family)